MQASSLQASLQVVGPSRDRHQELNFRKWKGQSIQHRRQHHTSLDDVFGCSLSSSQPTQNTRYLQGPLPTHFTDSFLRNGHQVLLQSQCMGHLHRVETQRILCLGLSEEALLNISEFLLYIFFTEQLTLISWI